MPLPPDASLELVWSQVAEPALGTRWAVSASMHNLIGSKGTPIAIAWSAVSRKHCEVSWRDEQWWLSDLKSKHGTLLEGKRVQEAALINGSLIGVSPGVQLRFTTQDDPPWPDESAPFIAGLRENPDDRAAWLVFSDWLQERGHPLGERIARGLPPNDAAAIEWLGPLGPALRREGIKAAWRNGVVEYFTLGGSVGSWRIFWLLQRLASLPVGAFVKGVVLAEPREEVNQHAASVRRVLQAVAVLDGSLPLQLVRLEGVWSADLTAEARGLWGVIRKRFPKITTRYPAS